MANFFYCRNCLYLFIIYWQLYEKHLKIKKININQLEKFFLFLALFSMTNISSGQNTDSLYKIVKSASGDSARIIETVNLSMALSDEHPDSAMLILLRAETFVPKKNTAYLNAKILSGKALIFQKIEKYPEALQYFYEVKNTLENFQGSIHDTIITKFYLSTLNSIGILFFTTSKLNEAIEYFVSGIKYYNQHIYKQYPETNQDMMFRFNLNICGGYLQLRDFKKAGVYATKAMQYLDEDDFQSYASLLNNLSIIARETGDLDKAFDLNRQALSVWKEHNDERGMVQAYNNLGHCYLTAKNKIKALTNYQLAYEICKKKDYKSSALISLEMLSGINAELNNFEKAYKYHVLFKEVSDSLMNIKKIRQITQLEMQEKFNKHIQENQIKQDKKEAEQKTRELIYGLIIVFSMMGLVILVLLYFLQRSKSKRLSLESEKINIETKNLQLEKSSLVEQLEFKNKELATNVMYIVRKNELITGISEKLIRSKIAFKKENQVIIDEIIKDLQSTTDDEIWKEFEIRFQQVYNDFYNKLHEKIPNLTANEKKLCAFLRLNMSTKEISAITFQSINSLTVARSRLRKKIGLETDESLISFLESI